MPWPGCGWAYSPLCRSGIKHPPGNSPSALVCFGPAQRAGIAALKERDYLEATKRLIGPERERMKGKLVELGFQVYPSQANYIFSEILSGRKGFPL